MIKLIPSKPIDKFDYLKHMRKHATEKWSFINWLTPCTRPTIPFHAVGIDKFYPTYEVQGTVVDIENINNIHVFHLGDSKEELFHDSVPERSSYKTYGAMTLEGKCYLVLIGDDAAEPPFRFGDIMPLSAGDIDNYQGPDCVTDVGKFLVNQVVLVDPFGSKIPYINARISPGDTDEKVAKMITRGEIGREEYNKYMMNGYWFGSDAGITTVTMTEKAMVTDPEVAKRRKELLEKHKHELDDPQVTVAIEQELIAMDKDWIKHDDSYAFYDSDGGKVFKEQRKKMHLMFGTGVAFDKDANKYTFYEKPLSDGWDPKSISICANDTRRGSYGRGIDTAKGGEQTKFLLRVFQEVLITEDDCKAKTGIKVVLNENIASQYFGRYLMSGVVLSKENYKEYLGKEVEIRSPMHCKTVGGFCYRCCGKTMKDVGMRAIGMQAIRISSKFTSVSMKAIHASSASSTTIKGFTRFLV